jgi:Winged helix-turn helix
LRPSDRYIEGNPAEVLLRVQSGRLRVTDACVLIGLQRRQVFRLLRGLKQDGAASLLSKHRGKPSKRTGSQWTLRWREMDSNFRYRVTRPIF